MTYEKLAALVADDFKRTMVEEGFGTFSEMKKCYMWDTEEIKDECNAIITELSKKVWETDRVEVYMADDNSFVQIGLSDEMSWGNFKKLVFANLK